MKKAQRSVNIEVRCVFEVSFENKACIIKRTCANLSSKLSSDI